MTVIYTIGYEGTDIDRFVATLKAVGVKRVADVRAVALSRKKGFSKRSLAARLEQDGIEYVHFIQLGDPKEGRDAAKEGLYEKFRTIYGEHLRSELVQLSLSDLAEAVGEKPTCLLCFERDPRTCHRSIVATEIAAGNGTTILDLYGDDPERYVRHAAKLPNFNPRQSAPASQ